MRTLTKTLSIVLMAIGIIVLVGCKKEESNNDNQSENLGVNPGSIWQGGGNCAFEYEDENVNVYLSSRIAFIGGNIAEFRLEGLPEGGGPSIEGWDTHPIILISTAIEFTLKRLIFMEGG